MSSANVSIVDGADSSACFSWFTCAKRQRKMDCDSLLRCKRRRTRRAEETQKALRKLIDLNEASIEQMQGLPCIGEKRAQEISKLRAEKPLESLHDLLELEGIGQGSLEKIGRYAYVDPELGLRSEQGLEDQDADLRRRCQVLLVGSWNVRNLGKKSLETGRAKDVAAIVAEYDVLALLELRDEEIVEGLLDILGKDSWGAAMSSEVGTEHHKEVYAYLYRKSAVTLQKAQLLADPVDTWVREPFMAYFGTPGGFDFVIAAVHIVWGKSVSERRQEVEALGQKLGRIRNSDGEKDVLLVGDFNTEPDDEAWDCARDSGWVPLLEEDGMKSMVGDTHLYDNIWVNSVHTASSEWLGAAGTIHFDQVLDFGKSAKTISKNAIKELSDHRPIWGLFATDVDDDELTSAGLPLFRARN